MTKKLLIIAAIAVMLAGATNAYAYHEWWDGWFNSGYLEYKGDRYDYVEGEGVLEDLTYGSVDSFFVSATDVSTFTCDSGEYEGYYIMLYPMATGWKYTGQSGQKEAHDGTWSGMAILSCPDLPPDTFDVEGTWDTDDAGDYFDYYPERPTYSAEWYLSDSDPDGITYGEGGSSGELRD